MYVSSREHGECDETKSAQVIGVCAGGVHAQHSRPHVIGVLGFAKKKQSSTQLHFVFRASADCLELTVEMHTAQFEAHYIYHTEELQKIKCGNTMSLIELFSTGGLALICLIQQNFCQS